MIVSAVQRWRACRDSYRPVGEPIRTADYDVDVLPDDTTARAFVEAHHYSGTFPAARFRVALRRHQEVVGVAVFSHPCNDAVLTRSFPGVPTDEAVELGRFVLLDGVPSNGETWFLARAFELLRREGFVGVVSHADPVARTDVAGRVVFPGHVGTIYQAHNGRHTGRARARVLALLPDGTVFSERAQSKIRARHRGWRYAVDQLVAAGADAPAAAEDLSAWLARELARVTRPLRHGGNLRYVWALDRAVRRVLPPALPFPKFEHARAA